MPDDNVNASRSTGDAQPPGLCVGLALGNLRLIAALYDLIDSFRVRGRAFALMVKVGRTPRENAGPMALGREFTSFAHTLAGEVRALEAVQRVLWEDALGAATIEASQDMRTFVHYSSCMKGLAVTLSKICHDLRLLSSDEQPGARAISPPPGTFNMPGETNPTISPAAARIFEAQTMLIETIDTLRVACVEGVTARTA